MDPFDDSTYANGIPHVPYVRTFINDILIEADKSADGVNHLCAAHNAYIRFNIITVYHC